MRYQSRRTPTPGKVFSPSEILEGELAINMPDRKLYAKDDHGVVFQVAASPGMNSGNGVTYADPFGGNRQVIPVRSDAFVWFRREQDTETDGQTVFVTRNPREYLGAITGTQHALRVQTILEKRTNQFEWNLASVLELRVGSAGGGEHCATYSQVVKRADASGWALCLEARDFVPSPDTGTVTAEMGLFVKGDDPHNRRIGVHMALNAADNTPISQTGVINKIGSAFVVGGPDDYVRVGSMFTFQGNAEVHLDLTETSMSYHDVGMAWQPNQKLSVQGKKTVNLDGTRVRAAEVASLFWSSTEQTWVLGGVPVTAGAVTTTQKAKVLLNGVPFYINVQPA